MHETIIHERKFYPPDNGFIYHVRLQILQNVMSQTMLKVTLLVENVEMTIHEVTKIAYRSS